ncbi:MAG TPA: glycosyltransferase family 4 protein [Solirubrobacteraceae bacterium]|nr:glycosyltransferase family 4 protein [Solirubrobacteraceae bacterium]
MKPVLFVTGHAPFDREGAFARLHEREDVEFALFGGRSQHGVYDLGAGPTDIPASPARDRPRDRSLPFPHRHVSQREVAALAASGRHRAVVVSTGGRIALPGAWAAARRAGIPLILWTSLWAHPRTLAHALSYPALLRLYRSADAVVTYGPHVSAYVRARGARNVHVAPQSVDNEFWSHPLAVPDVGLPPAPPWPEQAAVKFLFAGRPVREKGLGVLREAWLQSGLAAPSAALVLVGVGSIPPWVSVGGAAWRDVPLVWRLRSSLRGSHGSSPPIPADGVAPRGMTEITAGRATPSGVTEIPAGGGAPGEATWIPAPGTAPDGVVCLDPVPPTQLRSMYAAADVLVAPSIATRTFREPWGLVVNEAMNRSLPVIASDAVGAVAGGLVRDGRNGLVVPTGDPRALAAALRRLADDPPLRARLGAAGADDVQAFTHAAWAQGFASALDSLGLSRGGRW